MARKYSKKASEKIGDVLHEFKRGKLKSSSGRKVTSREQALAIGISKARRAGYKVPSQHALMNLDNRVRVYLRSLQPEAIVDARGMARALGVDPLDANNSQAVAVGLRQARRAGYKVAPQQGLQPEAIVDARRMARALGVDPLDADSSQAVAVGLRQARRAGYKVAPQQGHAAMSLDARVRDYLSNMKPGTEIDARGIARALGGIDPLEADYALERAQKQGLAVTSDGRWFGPVKMSTAQVKRDIAKVLAQPKPETIKLKDRYSGNPVHLSISDGRIIGVMGSDPGRYMGMTVDEAKHYARYGGKGRSSHATVKFDSDDARMFGRYAHRMGQTRAQALAHARTEGFASHQLEAVGDGWDAERSNTQHGGFAGGES